MRARLTVVTLRRRGDDLTVVALSRSVSDRSFGPVCKTLRLYSFGILDLKERNFLFPQGLQGFVIVVKSESTFDGVYRPLMVL